MTGVTLTLPDDPADVPGWLEGLLLGPDLDAAVAELAHVHGPAPAPPLGEVLGPHEGAVMGGGLAALPRPSLGLLLRHPALLPELRDRVLTAGGPYWDRYLGRFDAAADRVLARVGRTLAPAEPVRGRGWKGYAVASLATAAAVLAAVYAAGGLRSRPIGPTPRPDPEVAAARWGFQKVDQLPGGDAAALAALAGLADEWSRKRPDTPADLLQRLVEFRHGCGAVQLADALPLSAREADWLRLRCADWAAEIDGHIRALERTRDAVAVRAAADGTAARIAGELRARAARAG
jgi:hypothetical protein